MHSSRMRTVRNSRRLLGGGAPGGRVSARGGVCSEGGLLLGEVLALGGSAPGGVCSRGRLLGGGVCSEGICLLLGEVPAPGGLSALRAWYPSMH